MSTGIASGDRSYDGGIATALVTRWVRFYTFGMSPLRRELRREQVANDVWEHRADRCAEGRPSAAVGLEIVGRCLRGIPEDILWRFHVEGFAMNIQFSVNRVVGATFIALMLFLAIGSSIQGYDASRDGFEGELERAARAPGGWNTAVFLIAGVGVLAAAAAVLVAFGERSRKLSLLTSIGLAATGILVLVSAALYGAFATLADDFLAASAAEQGAILANARTLLLVLDGTVGATTLVGCVSVWGVALITTRLRLVPRWINVFVGISAAGVLLLVVGSVTGPEDLTWPGFGLAVLGIALWLIFAGGWLAFGGGTASSPPDSEDAPGRNVASPPVMSTVIISLLAVVVLLAAIGMGGWAVGLIVAPVAAAFALATIVWRARAKPAVPLA